MPIPRSLLGREFRLGARPTEQTPFHDHLLVEDVIGMLRGSEAAQNYR
jgi:predicted metal-dependent enzyme (double-stranded beta helix superfamily)